MDEIEFRARRYASWRFALQIILWIAAIGCCVLAVVLYSDRNGEALARSMSQLVGLMVGGIGATGVIALLLAFRWRVFLWVALAVIALPVLTTLVMKVVHR